MKFKSKVDWWMHISLGILPAVNVLILVMYLRGGGLALLIPAIGLAIINVFLVLPIRLRTYYVLHESELHVKCGLGKGVRIPYKSISSLKESKSPNASAALSFDRIEIIFGKNGYVLISPKNKAVFLKELKSRRKNKSTASDSKNSKEK
jgi:hypothetical protein